MATKRFQPDKTLFRANDIRGLALGKDANLTADFAYHLGRIVGTLMVEKKRHEIWVCRDARLSSPQLHQSLVSGLLESGIDVLDIGIGPTPLLSHATITSPQPHSSCQSGIMITASHNPMEQNGFKIVIEGRPFYGEKLAQLREKMADLAYSEGCGKHIHINHRPTYIADLTHRVDDLSSSNFRVVVDAANGCAGPLAVEALTAAGIEVIPLYCDMDGRFPNHSPDTGNAENLRELVEKVVSTGAHMGVALDGDGDRMVAVTHRGEILNADRLMTIFSEDVLKNQPGTPVVFDVKISTRFIRNLREKGGIPKMTASGRSLIQSAMITENASLAGEFSCHFFFADKWHRSDDGIYAAARLLEICQKAQRPLAEIGADPEATFSTEELYIDVDDTRKMDVIDRLVKHAKTEVKDANLVTIDGLRIEYATGWALARASNTSAKLTLRFEADSQSELSRLMAMMRTLLLSVEPTLKLGNIKE